MLLAVGCREHGAHQESGDYFCVGLGSHSPAQESPLQIMEAALKLGYAVFQQERS